jgi:hypothetical protein
VDRPVASSKPLVDNRGMGVRVLLGVALAVSMPSLAHGADCITVQETRLAIAGDATCGGLKLKSGTRSGLRADDRIDATWVEYASPGGPGEWRYNDWVQRQLANLDADRPAPAAGEQRREDHWTIQSLYRSDQLISARYLRHACCGGGRSFSSINVALLRWTLFSPDELVGLAAAAEACWGQFGDDASRGAAFAAAWPVGGAWRERDFEARAFGRQMREIIGPLVIDRVASTGRTRRLFVQVLRDQSRWSIASAGATIDFGDLMGRAGGSYACTLANRELQAMARPGAVIPP